MRSAFQVNTNATTIAARLGRDVTDQLPEATALALNTVRDRITKGERRVMQRVFDRPTPYTLRSFFATKASPSKLRTETGLRDWAGKGTPATKYISPHVFGGGRNTTRFESHMRRARLIGGNEYLIPAPGAELDSYGNVKRGTYTRILSAFQALPAQGYSGNRSDSKRSQRKAAKFQYFIGADADGTRAIWQRVDSAFGKGIKPIFWVTSREPRYRKRFAFFEIAENIHKAHYERDFVEALNTVLAKPQG